MWEPKEKDDEEIQINGVKLRANAIKVPPNPPPYKKEVIPNVMPKDRAVELCREFLKTLGVDKPHDEREPGEDG